MPGEDIEVQNNRMSTNLTIWSFILTIVVAIVGTYVNVSTYWKSWFEEGEITAYGSDRVQLFHFKSGQLGIVISNVFDNSGARSKVIKRLGVLISSRDDERKYFMEPVHFISHVDVDGIRQGATQFSPIEVPPRAGISKIVVFRSDPSSPGDISILKKGIYKIQLLGWIAGEDDQQVLESFEVSLEKKNADALVDWQSKKIDRATNAYITGIRRAGYANN